MPHQPKTFRIFVSSTFSDLKAERNALQEKVFPELQKLCEANGCRFQAVDLRWGVSEEAALDQQTMNICLTELKRCQVVSPRPNFIILLGDRYGWIPLPPQVEASEFEEILSRAADDDKTLLAGWYRLDKNALPPEYVLRPRREEIFEEVDYTSWGKTEERLRTIFLGAIDSIGWPMDEKRRIKYECSATHQEIIEGALKLFDEREHVFAFLRNIRNVEALPPGSDYTDAGLEKARVLKKILKESKGVTSYSYDVAWNGQGLHSHIDQFAADALASLRRIIEDEFRQLRQIDDLTRENIVHEEFGAERRGHFVGRQKILNDIATYMRGEQRSPLVVYGPSGSGKSALMAKAVLDAANEERQATITQRYIIQRFVGATPDSTDIRTLLRDICLEISHAFEFDRLKEQELAEVTDTKERDAVILKYEIHEEYQYLSERFRDFLGMIPANCRLLLFLDALDQLSTADNAHLLRWLPRELPANVNIVISVLDRDDDAGLCLRAARSKFPVTALLPLGDMTHEEGTESLRAWLMAAKRTLTDTQRKRVLAGFHRCSRPLYLKMAIEEASRWKSFDRSPNGADEAPELAVDVPGIGRDMLVRLEDRRNHGEVLVKTFLGLLSAARHGLSETEILELLKDDVDVMADLKARSARSPEAKSIPVVVWLRLYHDMVPYLMEQSADGTVLINFYHRQVGEIVRQNYHGARYHAILAHYFGEKPLWIEEGSMRAPNQRKCAELPYQQTKAGSLLARAPGKCIALTDLRFVEAKCTAGMVFSLFADYDQALSEAELGNSDRKSVNDFGRFVRACSHRLSRRPDLAAQEALNFARSADVCDQAREILTHRGLGWIRRVRAPANDGTYARCIQTLEAGSCSTIAVTPDGITVVTALTGADLKSSVVKAWDLNTGNCRDVLSGERVNVHSLRQGGSRLVVLTERRRIGVLDLAFGLDCWDPLVLESDIKALDVSSDGEWVILLDAEEQLSAWDLCHRKRLWVRKNTREALSICLSPDGQLLVIGGGEEGMPGEVEVFRASDGEHISSIQGHEECVYRVLVLRNSHYVQTWSIDGKIRIWDTKSRVCLKTVPCTLHLDAAMDVTTDGRYTLTVGEVRDHALVWDIASGASPVVLSGHTGSINGVAITPNGSIAVTAASDDTVRVWDLQHEAEQVEVEGHRYGVRSVAMTLDQRVVSAADSLKVWNLFSSAPKSLDRQEGHTRLLAVLPDCRRVLWNIPVQWTLMAKQIRVVDIDTGRCEHVLKGHNDEIESIVVLPDGCFALSGARNDTIRMWDLRTGECSRVFPGGQNVCLSPDGRFFASIAAPTGLIVRSLSMGKPMWSDRDTRQAIIAVLPDAARLVVAREECIEMRNLMSGKLLWRNERGTGLGHAVLAVTPDGRYIVLKAYERDIRALSAETGHEVRQLQGTSGSRAISPLPDGKHLVSCEDDAVHIWNLDSGSEIGCYLTTDPAWSCSVGMAGRFVVAGGSAGHVYLLMLEGFSIEPPAVTAWRKPLSLFGFKQSTYAFGCPFCRVWSQHSESYAGMECECPNCNKRIKLNSFILSADWQPVAKAWEVAAERLKRIPHEQTGPPHFQSSYGDTSRHEIPISDVTVQTVGELSRQEEAIDALAFWCVGRDEYLAQLDDLITLDKKLVILLGEHGIGKTVFLSRWAKEYAKANPGNLVITHLVGASLQSTSAQAVSNRLTALAAELMEKATSHAILFDKLIIIVIDALDLVDDTESWRTSDLLPTDLPSNVRMVVSATPSETLWELRKRDHTELVLRGLDAYERKAALKLHVAAGGRELSDDQMERIVQIPQTENPLFLVLIARLIREMEPGESLDMLIDSSLSKDSSAGLYDLLFDRLERQWKFEPANAPRQVMSMLWAVKHGLMVDELLEIVAITPECWHQLYPHLQEWIINRSDLLVLANDYMREAVHLRYLPTAQEQKDAWITIVKCLIRRGRTPRTISELMRLLALTEEWDLLKDLLIDREIFRIGWKMDRAEYVRTWKTVCRHCRFDLKSVMRIALDPHNAWSVVELLDELDQLSLSYEFKKHLVGIYREAQTTEWLLMALAAVADGALKTKKPNEALAAAEELEVLCNQLGDTLGLIDSVVRQADAWRQKDDWGRAEMLYNKMIERYLANDCRDASARALEGLGLIRLHDGHLDEALKCFRQAGEMYQRAGNKRELVESLARQAKTCNKLGEIDEAIKLLEDQERAAVEIGFKPGAYTAIANRANLLDEKFNAGTARRCRKRAERLEKEILAEKEAYAFHVEGEFGPETTDKNKGGT